MCRLCERHLVANPRMGSCHISADSASAVVVPIYETQAQQTRHAIALAVIANNAMRQTRVGTIQIGKRPAPRMPRKRDLNAALLRAAGLPGPHDYFRRQNTEFFLASVGPFQCRCKIGDVLGKMMDTHHEVFPAEYHAQSAIEALLNCARVFLGGPSPRPSPARGEGEDPFQNNGSPPLRERAG